MTDLKPEDEAASPQHVRDMARLGVLAQRELDGTLDPADRVELETLRVEATRRAMGVPVAPASSDVGRWQEEGICPRCGGAVRFDLSPVDDWDQLNVVIVRPPDQPQSWMCPHCQETNATAFTGWLGRPVKPRDPLHATKGEA